MYSSNLGMSHWGCSCGEKEKHNWHIPYFVSLSSSWFMSFFFNHTITVCWGYGRVVVALAKHVLFLWTQATHHTENSLHEIFIYVRSRQHLFYQIADSIYTPLIEPPSKRLKALSCTSRKEIWLHHLGIHFSTEKRKKIARCIRIAASRSQLFL